MLAHALAHAILALSLARLVASEDAYLSAAITKIMPDGPAPPPSSTPAVLIAARNEYEPVLLVLSGAQTVSGVSAAVPGTGVDARVYRVGYVNVTNITDCDSTHGPGPFTDPTHLHSVLAPGVLIFIVMSSQALTRTH